MTGASENYITLWKGITVYDARSVFWGAVCESHPSNPNSYITSILYGITTELKLSLFWSLALERRPNIIRKDTPMLGDPPPVLRTVFLISLVISIWLYSHLVLTLYYDLLDVKIPISDFIIVTSQL